VFVHAQGTTHTHTLSLHDALPIFDRGELAVDVGEADVIEIDERQPADAAPRERLDRPGPDATHSDHCNMRRVQPLERVAPVEARESAEAMKVVVGHREGRMY